MVTEGGLRKPNISQSGSRKRNDSKVDGMLSFTSSALARKETKLTLEAKGRKNYDPKPTTSGDSSVSPAKPIRPFTLDELKYVAFLQPKVILSGALNKILTRHLSEQER